MTTKLPTEEMIEAGVRVYRETVSHGATFTEALPAIYLAMQAALPLPAETGDNELREQVRDFIYNCTKDEFDTGWTLSAHQANDLIAIVASCLSVSTGDDELVIQLILTDPRSVAAAGK